VSQIISWGGLPPVAVFLAHKSIYAFLVHVQFDIMQKQLSSSQCILSIYNSANDFLTEVQLVLVTKRQDNSVHEHILILSDVSTYGIIDLLTSHNGQGLLLVGSTG